MRSGAQWLRIEVVLAVLGVLFFAHGAFSLIQYHLYQGEMPAVSQRASPPPSVVRQAEDTSGVHVAARLEIPRLKVSLPVLEGNEEAGLALGAVHLNGSAVIGGMGNAVLAGHRDTAFWPLRNIRLGDVIVIKTDRPREFIVKSIHIVDPSDVSVLDGGIDSVLTLVTCYPFRFVGSAPRRLVVRAKLIG